MMRNFHEEREERKSRLHFFRYLCSSIFLKMIEYIKGELTDLQPATAIVEAGGIGYEISITLPDFSRLEQEKAATVVKFYVHESIREDAHVLFGFLSPDARTLFRLLTGVSGVGPSTARLILSSVLPDDLRETIAMGDDTRLKAVKGIGAKTAQRIIVDLKDKINTAGLTFNSSAGSTGASMAEALAALTTLGFTQAASQKVLRKIFSEQPSMSVEEALRMAFKML